MWRLRKLSSYMWDQLSSAGLKELFKYVALSLAALVGTILLSLFNDILRIDSPQPSWRAVLDKIRDSGTAAVRAPLAATLQSIGDDWARTIGIFALVAGYIVLFVLIRRGRYALSITKTPLGLARRAGLGGHWNHASIATKDGAPWRELCADISRPDNLVLYILGANGADTFGKPGAPLYSAMQNFHGTIHVILCDPIGEEIAARAKSVTVTPGEYRRSVDASERRLRDLRRLGRTVEGRYYKAQPSWKLIITNRTAWVQYYMPNGKHVAETPVWRFDVTPNGDGLFHLFYMDFARVWRGCADNQMRFED